MNDVSHHNPYVTDYPDIFNCKGFDTCKTCVHLFDTHTLMYVYSGEMLIYDGHREERVNEGGCCFIHKGETLRLSVIPGIDEECHVMKMILPRHFLCELYHCQYYTEDTEGTYAASTGHLVPANAAITSLFQSLVPFYNMDTKIPQNLHRLKLTEAVMALLSHTPGNRKWLFDFAYTPMTLLDMVQTPPSHPMNWQNAIDENTSILNCEYSKS